MVFEKLEKRMILDGVIEAVTPLHIGAGKPEMEIEEVDMPILRAPDRVPYIPGSSLKGKLRSELERLAKAKGLRHVRTEEGCAIVELGPGRYEFQSSLAVVARP